MNGAIPAPPVEHSTAWQYDALVVSILGVAAAVGIVGFGALKWLRAVERASQMWNDEADL